MPTSSPTSIDVFVALAQALAARDWSAAADLYAKNVRITSQFDPNGPIVKTGRESVREFFTSLGERLDSLIIENAILTQAADSEILTAEFIFVGSTDGEVSRFALPAVLVLRVRDGQIIESHDYIGPRQRA